MSETLLDEVLRQCTAAGITTKQLGNAICTIASSMRDGSIIAGSTKSIFSNAENNDGKEYFKEEIKRVEEVIEGKTNGVKNE